MPISIFKGHTEKIKPTGMKYYGYTAVTLQVQNDMIVVTKAFECRQTNQKWNTKTIDCYGKLYTKMAKNLSVDKPVGFCLI